MQDGGESFISRFRNGELGPQEVNHRAHLYLAWLYLKRHSVDEACALMCADTRAFAESLGVPGKYHHTVTEGLMRIVAARMALTSESDFDRFLAANTDLLSDARGLLAHHFSDARLKSEEARRSWMEPDLTPID